jgi:hypothetical protein
MNNQQFKKYIEHFKNKSADNVFQNANFNHELIRYAVNKVIKNDGIPRDFLEKPKLIQESDSKLSIYIFLTMVLLSIGLIFIHFYLYMKNPKKFFQRL